MDIKSKAGPINVLVISQEPGGGGAPIPHTTPDNPSYQVAQPHDQLVETGRTMSEHYASNSTEVRASVTGTITTPKVIKQETPSVADHELLMSVQEILEMSQEEGKTSIGHRWQGHGLIIAQTVVSKEKDVPNLEIKLRQS